jgi:ABC-type transporter Mla subunit MlaD
MTKEDLQQIAELLKPINERLDRIQEDLEATKENTEITRSAVNALVDWADNVAVVTGQRFPVRKAE